MCQGRDWDELRGNAPRRWGEEETPAKDYVRCPQLYRHLQGSHFPPSPPHSPGFLESQTWIFDHFLSSISWLRLGGNPLSHQPSWLCVTSSLSISLRKQRSKELSVWSKSLQSWREGVLMLPNFAGMKWNLQRSWRKWNICSVVTLGSPDEHWGPSVADAFHADAAGVLALVTAASPLVP